MPISRGEHLLHELDCTGSVASRGNLRAYVLRLERIAELARRMYENEVALRGYRSGSYRVCDRCGYTFRSHDSEAVCPFCLYAQRRPRTTPATRATTREAA